VNDTKVIKITGPDIALDTAVKKIDLLLTDNSLNYYDITVGVSDTREGEVRKLSCRVADRAGAKLQVSLDGAFFVADGGNDKPFLREEVAQGLRIILQNLTLTLSPELYYGKRLYSVLDMDLPRLLVPGNNKVVALGSAASRSYESIELIFNSAREPELEGHLKNGRVDYEIHTTRYDGRLTIAKSGSLSFAQIKGRKSSGFTFDIGGPMSAVDLSSIRLSYQITTPDGNIEDERKDFLQLRLVEGRYQKIDLKAVNRKHTHETLEVKFPLEGETLFNYLDIRFPTYPVFQEGAGALSFNSLHRLDVEHCTQKTASAIRVDLSALASTVYLDRHSFLRIKGVTYFENEPPAGFVDIAYEMFDEHGTRLGSGRYQGRCTFRAAAQAPAASGFINLAAPGTFCFFELDIQDSRIDSSIATVAYYQVELSAAFPAGARHAAVVTEVEFYYNRYLNFEAIAEEQDFPFDDFHLESPVLEEGAGRVATLKRFLDQRVLAYTTLAFSFERMANDVVIDGDLSEKLQEYASLHGYSKTGRRVFSTEWPDKSDLLETAAWWRGVDVLVFAVWIDRQDLAAGASPFSRGGESEFGYFQNVPYALSIKGQFNPYLYIPCLKGNHDYELDPLFSNTLYLRQGRSRVQGRGSLNRLYLLWDSQTTFDFAAEEDFARGVAPTRLKLIGVDIQSIVLRVPEPEHELWGSLILEWAVWVDPEKHLGQIDDPAVLAFIGESHAAIKEGSLTLVNFLKEPISEFIEFEIEGRVYTLETHPGDTGIHWRRQVDLSREVLGEKTVLSSLGSQRKYVLRHTILGQLNTPVYPTEDGQDILVARGEVAYLHGGEHETQLVGNLPENHFYLDRSGTDSVVASGQRNRVEISGDAGGHKVIFLCAKPGALNVIQAPAISFATARLQDDDLCLFDETAARLLTVCVKGILAWDSSRLRRISLTLAEGTFDAAHLIGLLRAARQADEQASYRTHALLPEPALQRGFVQLADTQVAQDTSPAFLKDRIGRHDVMEKDSGEGQ